MEYCSNCGADRTAMVKALTGIEELLRKAPGRSDNSTEIKRICIKIPNVIKL